MLTSSMHCRSPSLSYHALTFFLAHSLIFYLFFVTHRHSFPFVDLFFFSSPLSLALSAEHSFTFFRFSSLGVNYSLLSKLDFFLFSIFSFPLSNLQSFTFFPLFSFGVIHSVLSSSFFPSSTSDIALSNFPCFDLNCLSCHYSLVSFRPFSPFMIVSSWFLFF